MFYQHILQKFLLLALLSPLASFAEEDSYWYMLAGVSLYDEDIDYNIGSGISPRLALGTQIDESFGVELVFDQADPVDPHEVAEFLAVTTYDITTTSNQYRTVFGTYSVPMTDKTSFIGKLGYSSYEAEIDVKASVRGTSIEVAETLSGWSPALSAGLLIKIDDEGKNQVEAAVTHYTDDDVKATAFTASWRFSFK